MYNALIYIFPAMLVVAAVSDIACFEIPNWVSIVLVAGYVLIAFLNGAGVGQIAVHLGAGAALFAVGAVLFYFGAFGGGDVKLLAASAVWVGWQDLLPYLIVVALAGGVVTLLLLVFRWVNKFVGNVNEKITADDGPANDSPEWLKRLLSPEKGVPYGVAIGLAGLLIFSNVRDQINAISGL